MASRSATLEASLNVLNDALSDKQHKVVVGKELEATKGDRAAALENLKKILPDASMRKVVLTHSLADLSDDNIPMVKAT
jgi:hypothetical protein